MVSLIYEFLVAFRKSKLFLKIWHNTGLSENRVVGKRLT